MNGTRIDHPKGQAASTSNECTSLLAEPTGSAAKVRDDDCWVRSGEIRKALKLTTCELAHLRSVGKIESKKEGNAYLYKLDADDRDLKPK